MQNGLLVINNFIPIQYNNRGKSTVNSLDIDDKSTIIIAVLFCAFVIYIIIRVWLGLKNGKTKDSKEN